MEKECMYCHKPLERKEGERLCNYKTRITCNKVCSGKLRAPIPKYKINRSFVGAKCK
jgi:hypothetical protein